MTEVVLTSIKTQDFTNENINATVSRAINLLDYDIPNKTDSVVIKPNLCYYWDYSTGETTDPRVVSAVIDYVRENVNRDVQIFIAEADASAMATKYAFKFLGYEKLSLKKKVKLVNLSEGEILKKEVKVRNRKLILPLNKILLESDLIINIPKLKYHRRPKVTCSLKNMFGAIAKPRKFSYHPQLSDVIVGINKLVKSDIVIVDGIIALGKYPKRMGVVIAGNDALSTDFVSAQIMGYNPKRIAHLSLAQKEHVGNANNINLIEDGIKLEEIKSDFPKQNYLLQKISWKLQLRTLKVYAKIVGDIIPPILDE